MQGTYQPPRHLRGVVGATVAALALLAPVSAQAAVLQVSDATMTYTAAAGEGNRPSDLELIGGEYRFSEESSSPITVGSGCRSLGSSRYACTAAGVNRINVSLGDLSDGLELSSQLPVGTNVRGGSAVDSLSYFGGGVFVIVDGKRNDGGSGQDYVVGDIEQQFGTEAGDLLGGDTSNEYFRPRQGNDSVFGGAGKDEILVAVPGDEEEGLIEDGDDSASGGAGDDEITAASVIIDGAASGLLQRSGRDRISCGPDKDFAIIDDGDSAGADCEVLGTLSQDGQVFRGSAGNDDFSVPERGDGGFSRASGLDGNDVIRARARFQPDQVGGGNGDDRIDVRDGSSEADLVKCDAGFDTVYADSKDAIRPGCERVIR